MLSILKIFLKLCAFSILASFASAVLLHFYAEIIYKYKSGEDWYYIRNEADISWLFWLNLHVYAISSFVLFIILLINEARKKTLLKIRIGFLLLLITCSEIIIIALTVGGLKHLISLRFFLWLLLYLLPVLLIDLFHLTKQAPRTIRG